MVGEYQSHDTLEEVWLFDFAMKRSRNFTEPSTLADTRIMTYFIYFHRFTTFSVEYAGFAGEHMIKCATFIGIKDVFICLPGHQIKKGLCFGRLPLLHFCCWTIPNVF
jgi:hypothetical protein